MCAITKQLQMSNPSIPARRTSCTSERHSLRNQVSDLFLARLAMQAQTSTCNPAAFAVDCDHSFSPATLSFKRWLCQKSDGRESGMRRGSWCCHPRSRWRECFASRAYSARMLASQTCSSPNTSSHHFRLTSTCAAPEIRNAKCGEVRVRESMFMYAYKRLPETAVKGLVPGVLLAGLTLSFVELLRSCSLTLSDFIASRMGCTALGQKPAGCHNTLSHRKQTTSRAFVNSCYCRDLPWTNTFVSLGYPRFTRRIEVRIHVSNPGRRL